ncbi:hypothetical protein CEP52_012545 [Fusarium oligoseptatum]|uniref:Essential protein Yae1 N-terminal domain-containing protein n=1 Tax=Fusarium oligoseptatum TaxID=2604345 RepID=A0A428SY64_9HYPO|nr:hypothetical protein CEP52_012545 [Fusarium oligoseptatum]
MPRTGRFTRTVRHPTAFANAIRAMRRARRRAIIAAVVAAIRLMLPTRPQTIQYIYEEGRPAEPPRLNDEDLLDEFFRGHEQGYRLGFRRGHGSGYRQGLADGFARGLALGQERAYQAGYLDGAGEASD